MYLATVVVKRGVMMPEEKTLKELFTMRDACKDLLEHQLWLGDTIHLGKLLKRIEAKIERKINPPSDQDSA